MPTWLTALFERLTSDAYEPFALIVELLLIALSVNWCASVLQGTRGTRPLRGLLTVLVVATLVVRVLAVQFDWVRLELLYRYFLFGMAFVALIAFQPELRRAVIRAGDMRLPRRGARESKWLTELVKAVGQLAKNRHGALVAIQRSVGLHGWAENGTLINADVSQNLLTSVFYPNTALHDLGVIIADDRIVAANCQFPLAQGDEFDLALGSRHLAALGLSYETDALVVVVSEETGQISVADNGHLVRVASLEELTEQIARRLRIDAALAGRRALRWRRTLRRAAVVVPLTLIVWYLADQATQITADGIPVELAAIVPPGRVVDLIEPANRMFTVSVRGSTRAIERLRRETSREPLRVEWALPESYVASDDERGAGPREYTLPADEFLDRSAALRARGASVQQVLPARLTFTVDRVVTFSAPIRISDSPGRLADVRIRPVEAVVTLRAHDAARIAPEQRFVEARLRDRIASLQTDRPITLERVPLELVVNGIRPIGIDPPEAQITFVIVEQRVRRVLAGVTVQLMLSPSLLQRYDVELGDPNELRLELEVEGDRSTIDALRPADVRAFVPLGPELASTDGEFQSPEVVIVLPSGVSAVGPPRTVRLRLQERAGAP
ncbi:MAG: diadenylate cyclase [Phycisphaerae bacterium]